MSAFDVIQKLPFTFLSTPQVKAEIEAGEKYLHKVEFPEWINVLSLQRSISPMVLANLDLGEASVIGLALEQQVSLVCIDELKGRRAAASWG